MTYELAKQLKTAGFPQPSDDFDGDYLEPNKYATYEERVGSAVYLPTLSEFIEELGWHFVQLERWEDDDDVPYFVATNAYPESQLDVEGKRFVTKGKTPEEAVAKLWLALNKKND